MKSISFNLTLLLLLLAGPALADPAQVIDVDNNPVTTGSSYYILPVIRGNGGGLSLGRRNASFSCPLYVIQENQEIDRGLPVTFHPINSTEGTKTVVRVSTDMNVQFEASSICVQTTLWQLSGVEGERRFVRTGGEKGNPGIKTLSNWFKIERDETSTHNFYKLVFCPGVCDFCRVICGELGVIRENGTRFLGLAPQIKHLRVIFKKLD